MRPMPRPVTLLAEGDGQSSLYFRKCKLLQLKTIKTLKVNTFKKIKWNFGIIIASENFR
jgi:hypothetical protein